MRRSLTLPAASLALLLGSLAAEPAAGAEIVLLQDVPSRQEVNCILFGRCASKSGYTTRQVRFKTGAAPAAGAPPPPQQDQAVAATPATPAAAEPAVGEGSRGTVLGLNIHFAYNSTEIMPDSQPYLARLGEVLSEPDNAAARLVIVGHTDDAGSDEYNLSLSRRRAEAVKIHLARDYGIEPDRLSVEGAGEHELLPGLDGIDPQNRRVEFYASK
jgi:outer membrane protein OmpA-like peptidoglycan-associated protein